MKKRGAVSRAPAPGGTGDASAASVEQVAALLNLTPRRIQQLVVEKVLPRADRGRYNLPACVRGYIGHLQRALETAHARAVSGGSEELVRERVKRLQQDNAQGELDLRERLEQLVTLVVHEERITALAERLAAVLRGGLSGYRGEMVRAGVTPAAADRLIEQIGDDCLAALRPPDDATVAPVAAPPVPAPDAPVLTVGYYDDAVSGAGGAATPNAGAVGR